MVHVPPHLPKLVVSDNKFQDGQSWGTNYFVLQEFDTPDQAHAEARRLDAQHGLPGYFSPDGSTAVLDKVKAAFPDARMER